MGEEAEETAAISGDAVVIQVLAAAQRFAAWYVEFLSCDVASDSEETARPEAGRDHVAARVQHAVFDLIAAVHAMNRHYSGSEATKLTAAPSQGRRALPEPVH
ncbi:MAG: hypothetical protein NZ523_07020 [Elioraea sp.]|nr:hypothetical protein [Elioraea sp.]MDW8443541.1 hypothetical protein [Acetobacteraceae bacterium]